ncbi:DUF6290 family protein [Ruminococcaceae bacterium OttesenSCG-928-A16]|nr:DUF6290 family protein [Ruminococcaceae bacterium OttesenSCG-928-A16]
MAISMRLSEADEKLIRTYTEMHNVSISDFARNAMIEKIEDEIDLKAWHEAMDEFKKNPVTYTLAEIEEELGLK